MQHTSGADVRTPEIVGSMPEIVGSMPDMVLLSDIETLPASVETVETGSEVLPASVVETGFDVLAEAVETGFDVLPASVETVDTGSEVLAEAVVDTGSEVLAEKVETVVLSSDAVGADGERDVPVHKCLDLCDFKHIITRDILENIDLTIRRAKCHPGNKAKSPVVRIRFEDVIQIEMSAVHFVGVDCHVAGQLTFDSGGVLQLTGLIDFKSDGISMVQYFNKGVCYEPEERDVLFAGEKVYFSPSDDDEVQPLTGVVQHVDDATNMVCILQCDVEDFYTKKERATNAAHFEIHKRDVWPFDI